MLRKPKAAGNPLRSFEEAAATAGVLLRTRGEAAGQILEQSIRIMSEAMYAEYRAQISLRPVEMSETDFRRAFARQRLDWIGRAVFGRRSRFALDSLQEALGVASAKEASGMAREGDEVIVDPEAFLARLKAEPGENRPIQRLTGLCEPKRLAKSCPDTSAAIEYVGGTHPNCMAATERFAMSVRAQALAGRPLRFAPVLLHGAPGVGKTRFVNHLARAIARLNDGFEALVLPLAGNGDTLSISGNSRGWGNASPGRIARFMAQSRYSNPIIILDEVDKAGGSHETRVADILLNLLEPEQNKAFQDLYLEVPIDLSRVSFIATANEPERIPPALRSRMQQIEIRAPNQEELPVIAREVWREIVQGEGLEKFADPNPPRCLMRAASVREMQFIGREALYGIAMKSEMAS